MAQLRRRAVLFAACLLLPVIYLWFNYLNSAFQQVLFVQKEQQGIELASLLVEEIFDGIITGHSRLNELADNFHITIEPGIGKLPNTYKFHLLKKLQLEISTKSQLVLDSDKTTHYLISAGFVRASEALDHFATATVLAASAVGLSHDENSSNTAPILLASQLGSSITNLDGAAEDLDYSCNCDDNATPDYLDIKQKLIPFRNRGTAALKVLSSTSDREAALNQVGELLTLAELSHVGTAYNTFFEAVSKKIARSLAHRLWALWLNIGLITGVGSVISTFGLWVTFSIFRSSAKVMRDLGDSLTQSKAALLNTQRMSDEVAGLNHDLATKISELEKAQKELLDKSRFEQLGQLTATVAHEIRNPLGTIRTSAFSIGRKMGKDNPLIGPQLARISKGIERCDNIITQLLDFSRTKEIDAQPGNLDDWMLSCLQEEIERLPKELSIHCDLRLQKTLVPFDGARLRRAVVNVIQNAVDALTAHAKSPKPEGPEAPTIWVTTLQNDTHALIEIKDNGPGIPAEVLPKVMEPLFTTKSFGTGLGLSAVAQIAQQHGGILRVESEIGTGAKFTISLALATLQARLAA